MDVGGDDPPGVDPLGGITYTDYAILFSYISYYLQFKPTALPYALMTSKTLWTPS